jgi:UDP-N-acetylmuramoyl-tripeptide--D-alanyl-D-alanine ligase
VKLAGADVQKAAKALAQQEPIIGRGKRELIDSGDKANPITLIDESYNASPLAMNAAFKVLALVDPGRGGRRIAILGDMLELGKNSGNLHADLALPLKAANVDLVYTCGKHMKKLYENLPANQRGAHKETSQELAQIVPDVLIPGDVVMVKGSLGSKMGLVVEALRALPEKFKHITKV